MLLRENPSRKESNSSDRGHAVGFFFLRIIRKILSSLLFSVYLCRMIRKNIIFFIALCLCMLTATAQAQHVAYRSTAHYNKRVAQFEREGGIDENSIVMLGNSLTENGKNWSERLGISNVVNRGIIGDISELQGRDYATNKQLFTLFKMIAGSVGMGIANEFRAFLSVHKYLPEFKDIESGKVKEVDKKIIDRIDVMYALCSMITAGVIRYAREIPQEKLIERDVQLKADKFLTVIGNYIETMPNADMKAKVVSDIYRSVSKQFGSIINKNKGFNSSFAAIAKYL
jgi:hypothetical protein